MKVIEDKNNSLLKRREIKVIVEAEKNPTMQEAAKLVSENFESPGENISIKQIKGKFGRNTFLISANIYNSKEDKEKTEPKRKEKKGKSGQEAQKQEAGKEEKPEEKSKENKKA